MIWIPKDIDYESAETRSKEVGETSSCSTVLILASSKARLSQRYAGMGHKVDRYIDGEVTLGLDPAESS